jgi:hypothetical protein
MRHSIRRLVMAALACAFVATVVAAPVLACDGMADNDTQSAPSGK